MQAGLEHYSRNYASRARPVRRDMTDAPRLYLSPAEQATFLRAAPSLAGRVNTHRLGSDEDHPVHQSRVRLAYGVAEFYMCRDCELYG